MLLTILSIAAALGSGLIAGIFIAFSIFIMKSFGDISPAAAIASMQAINRVIVRTLFIPLFFATALVCAYLVVAGLLMLPEWRGAMVSLAGALYVAGCMLVTMICNVPRNNRLATLNADTEEAATYWSEYRRSWTYWNHVRTIASFLAALLLTVYLAGIG